MQPTRLFFALAGFVVLAGCGGPAPGAGTQLPTASRPPANTPVPATQPPIATTPPTFTPAPAITLLPVGTVPVAGTPAAGGGGTITYQITGDYQASGELAFDPAGSIDMKDFGGGWIAYFMSADGEINVRLSTQPDEEAVEVFLGEDVVRGGTGEPNSACTFTITKNDASGPAGSALCDKARLYPSQDTRVKLSIEWSVNL